jgi:hypothetical protein
LLARTLSSTILTLTTTKHTTTATVRIMRDNQHILYRLQNRKPFYDRRIWQRHAKKHAAHGKNLRAVRDVPIGQRLQLSIQNEAARRRGLSSMKPLTLRDSSDERSAGAAKASSTSMSVGMGANGGVESSGRGALEVDEFANNAAAAAAAAASGVKRLLLAKEGRTLDGKFVIVSVEERYKPHHVFAFETYDFAADDRRSLLISYANLVRVMVTLLDSESQHLIRPGYRSEFALRCIDSLTFAADDDDIDGGGGGGDDNNDEGDGDNDNGGGGEKAFVDSGELRFKNMESLAHQVGSITLSRFCQSLLALPLL